MNSDTLSKQIYERMRDKSSEELLTIWKENDRGLWSDEAFKAIEEILSSRKMTLPAQGQIKKSIPQSQLLEECWEKPFLSWAFYLLFLLWYAKKLHAPNSLYYRLVFLFFKIEMDCRKNNT